MASGIEIASVAKLVGDRGRSSMLAALHLAGAVGAKLFDALLKKRWLRRGPLARTIVVTSAGLRGLKSKLGVEVETRLTNL